MEDEQELSPTELEELEEYMGRNYPKQQEKAGIFQFFNKIIGIPNTTKVSNLDDNELFLVRILKNAVIYADDMGLKMVGEYLRKESEVILGTANSKNGFLIKAAITQKKSSEFKTRMGGEKKKWGQKRDEL